MLARWQSTITDGEGNIQPNAEVTVTIEGGGLAQLYSDREGENSIGNPITADGDGFVEFHVSGGAYRIDATLGGFSRTWRYVGIGTASEIDIDNILALLAATPDQAFDALAPTTTRGDIIYHGASSNLRLAKGTEGHVLAMGADDPGWVAPSGGGAWELIGGGAVSGTPSTIEFTGLDALTDFHRFQVVFINILPTTDDRILRGQVGTGATPTWVTAGDYNTVHGRADQGNGTWAYEGHSNDTSMWFAREVGNAAGEHGSGEIWFSLGGTNIRPLFNFLTGHADDSGNLVHVTGSARRNTAGAITAFRLLWSSSSTFAEVGFVFIYGQRNA